MGPTKLTISGDHALVGDHIGQIICVVGGQGFFHLLRRTRTAKAQGLRLKDPRAFFVKKAHQKLGRLHGWADQLKIFNRIQKRVGAAPVFTFGTV